MDYSCKLTPVGRRCEKGLGKGEEPVFNKMLYMWIKSHGADATSCSDEGLRWTPREAGRAPTDYLLDTLQFSFLFFSFSGVLCVFLAFYDACWKRKVPCNFLCSLLGEFRLIIWEKYLQLILISDAKSELTWTDRVWHSPVFFTSF